MGIYELIVRMLAEKENNSILSNFSNFGKVLCLMWCIFNFLLLFSEDIQSGIGGGLDGFVGVIGNFLCGLWEHFRKSLT